MKTRTKLILLAVAAAILAARLLACSGPSAPDLAEPIYDNPYDERGDNYIPTPDINTAPVTGIRALEAVSGGAFETDYGKPVTAKGVCWSTEEEPTVEDDCTNDGEGHDAFTSVMSDLTPEQTYYVRAYATNEAGTIYGGQREFTTMDGKPELRTHPAQEVRAKSAKVSGEVHGDGGAALLRWGVCYAENPEPTIADDCLDAEGSASQKPVAGEEELLTGCGAGKDGRDRHHRQSPNDFRGMGTARESDWNVGMPDGQDTAPGAAHQPASGFGSQESPFRQHSLPDAPDIHAGSGELTFSLLLEALTPGQTYYVRTFAVNEAGNSYGPEVSFTTRDGIPVLTTTEPFDVTAFSAKTGGDITDNGDAAITARGVCYVAGSGEPGLSDTCVASGSGTGSFEVLLEDLAPDQQYTVRAYATTDVGMGWGQEYSFTTTEGLAVLSTAEPGSVRAFSAVVGGQVSDEGDAPVTERGVCLSTNPQPDLEDRCEALGSGTGSFGTTIEDLDPSTLYYVRAYATNAAGTAWGQVREFTTRDGIPALTTTAPFDVTAFSAKTGGEITDDGGAEVTGRGVCYVEGSGEPGLSDTCMEAGSGTGSFEVLLEDLDLDQQYTVRAYATTEFGTGWGQDREFTTLDGIPTLTTTDPFDITAFSAKTGGDITDDGGAAITGRGVCYIEGSGEPGLSDSCVESGSGTGSFEVLLEELSPDRQYTVRAYATTDAGTGWGQEREFTTRDGIPVLTTTEPFDVTAFSVKTGGEISDAGGAAITGRGVCYVEGSGEPGLSDSCVESGSVTGSFEVLLEELSPDRQYTVRAYATTDTGTGWGQVWEFITRDTPVLTTTEPFDIRAFSAKTGGEISDDGGAEVIGCGVCFVEGSGEPGLSDSCVESGSVTGSFEVLLEDLDPDQQYTVRAYATTGFGTGWGQELAFITLQDPRDTETTVVDVTSPTGRVWMDRNLGASRAPLSFTDPGAHGDLYQWGRAADGHQKRDSDTTSTLSSFDRPGHGDFIISSSDAYWDWRSPQKDDLWQGVNGVNNPCPAGYRLPTEAEWNAERNSWSSNNASGAFGSPLKLPVAGGRSDSSGSLFGVGSLGFYWSSTVSGSLARGLRFTSSGAYVSGYNRAYGYSVRCLED